MSWHPAMDSNYVNSSFSYNSSGSFMNFFEGLAYEHANFIFSDALHAQESIYPAMQTNSYKFGLSEPGSVSYFDYSYAPVISDQMPSINEYNRHLGNSTTMMNERNAELHSQWEEHSSISTNFSHVDCPRGHQIARDHQVVWQDSVDPDNMTYEELLELGETVGSQSRGLPKDIISTLPVKKFKCGFFSRKKSRDERCVICQMEYKRADKQIILPCKHAYHVGCGTKWLSINKACPICYTEVFGDVSKQ